VNWNCSEVVLLRKEKGRGICKASMNKVTLRLPKSMSNLKCLSLLLCRLDGVSTPILECTLPKDGTVSACFNDLYKQDSNFFSLKDCKTDLQKACFFVATFENEDHFVSPLILLVAYQRYKKLTETGGNLVVQTLTEALHTSGDSEFVLTKSKFLKQLHQTQKFMPRHNSTMTLRAS